MATWDDVKQRVDNWCSFLKGLKPWKKVQQKDTNGEWVDVDSIRDISYLNDNINDFRLVDRPTRPYKNIGEFKEHCMVAELPDGSMPNLMLMLKAFDVEHKDKFYSQPFFIGYDFITSMPKDKETEMFHALYDNTTDDEGCPFGVVLEEGETFDNGEIPMTPIKTFGELKIDDCLHVLRYCNWLDSYYYSSNRIINFEYAYKGTVDIHLEHDLRTCNSGRINVNINDSCYKITSKYNYDDKDHLEIEWLFTNYFEMKRKFDELKKN